MFKVHRTYRGYVYYPNISNEQLLINISLFTSINFVGNARILRDCDKYLRLAMVRLSFPRQKVWTNQFSPVVLMAERKKSHCKWVAIYPKGNVTSHTLREIPFKTTSIYCYVQGTGVGGKKKTYWWVNYIFLVIIIWSWRKNKSSTHISIIWGKI